jgi:tetratricopeptide (TPR) repeat protein
LDVQRNTLAFVIAGALGGFIGGFWLANSINRTALITPASNIATGGANTSTATPPADDLSAQEIDDKIAEADQNPSNLKFQKDLGIGLYQYGAMKRDVVLLGEAVRILDRARSLNGQDADVLVALGNAHFDIGFFRKDAASFKRARDAYAKALVLTPGDPEVSTDFGITYYLQQPPDYGQAASELAKVSTANPKHERSLQFLIKTYVAQNKRLDAERTLAKLKSLNPKNSALDELSAEVESGVTSGMQ